MVKKSYDIQLINLLEAEVINLLEAEAGIEPA